MERYLLGGISVAAIALGIALLVSRGSDRFEGWQGAASLVLGIILGASLLLG